MADDEHALLRAVSKQHAEEQVHAFGKFRQALASRRSGEESPEGVP